MVGRQGAGEAKRIKPHALIVVIGPLNDMQLSEDVGFLTKVRQQSPSTKIMVIGSEEVPQDLREELQRDFVDRVVVAGADIYFRDTIGDKEVAAAVMALTSNEQFYSPHIIRRGETVKG